MLADRNAQPAAPAINVEMLAQSIANGDRAALARAITLVESKKAEHRTIADQLLSQLHSRTGGAYRIGVTGLPGVGKSTFIDQFGFNLVEEGHKVAVLAVDPSSSRTGGSILGDKTRMSQLAPQKNAYIRPSPSGKTLGGVARATRETMLLCEAAGFDVVIVETVGVGQSEATVSGMVDFFLALLLPGAGDELQGIKKGLLELADMIAINKADGELLTQATSTAADYKAALHILTRTTADWQPDVVAISARENKGLAALWQSIRNHREKLSASGSLENKRREQAVTWMHELIEHRLKSLLFDNPQIVSQMEKLERQIYNGETLPGPAAETILGIAGIGNSADSTPNSSQ